MALTVADAKRVILSFPNSAGARHMDRTAYRAGGRIFATLRDADGQLNILLPADVQQTMCEAEPKLLSPVPGGWGPMGWTQFSLGEGSDTDLRSVLQAAVAESLVNKRKKRR